MLLFVHMTCSRSIKWRSTALLWLLQRSSNDLDWPPHDTNSMWARRCCQNRTRIVARCHHFHRILRVVWGLWSSPKARTIYGNDGWAGSRSRDGNAKELFLLEYFIVDLWWCGNDRSFWWLEGQHGGIGVWWLMRSLLWNGVKVWALYNNVKE